MYQMYSASVGPATPRGPLWRKIGRLLRPSATRRARRPGPVGPSSGRPGEIKKFSMILGRTTWGIPGQPCAIAERSVPAARTAPGKPGPENVRHVVDGLDAWKKEGGPVALPETP